MEKLVSQITPEEWVRYHWIDVTSTSDSERRMLAGRERTLDEAAEARRQIEDARPVQQGSFLSRWFGRKA